MTSLAIRAASSPADIAVPGPGIVDATPEPTSMRAPAMSPFINLCTPNPSPAIRPTTGIFFSPTLTAVLVASFAAVLVATFLATAFLVAVAASFFTIVVFVLVGTALNAFVTCCGFTFVSAPAVFVILLAP